jgi:hypothetical protein
MRAAFDQIPNRRRLKRPSDRGEVEMRGLRLAIVGIGAAGSGVVDLLDSDVRDAARLVRTEEDPDLDRNFRSEDPDLRPIKIEVEANGLKTKTLVPWGVAETIREIVGEADLVVLVGDPGPLMARVSLYARDLAGAVAMSFAVVPGFDDETAAAKRRRASAALLAASTGTLILVPRRQRIYVDDEPIEREVALPEIATGVSSFCSSLIHPSGVEWHTPDSLRRALGHRAIGGMAVGVGETDEAAVRAAAANGLSHDDQFRLALGFWFTLEGDQASDLESVVACGKLWGRLCGRPNAGGTWTIARHSEPRPKKVFTVLAWGTQFWPWAEWEMDQTGPLGEASELSPDFALWRVAEIRKRHDAGHRLTRDEAATLLRAIDILSPEEWDQGLPEVEDSEDD